MKSLNNIPFLLISAILSLQTPVFAQQQTAPEETTVINRVKGGVEGIDNDTFSGGDGTGSAVIQLKVIKLRLHKSTYGLTSEGKMNDEALAQNARVVIGQYVYFTLHLENLTDAELYDIHLRDELDEQAFVYVPNSMAMALTDAGRPAREGDFSTSLSDVEDSDIAGIGDLNTAVVGPETLIVGRSEAKNALVSLAPGKRLTIRFKVQVL